MPKNALKTIFAILVIPALMTTGAVVSKGQEDETSAKQNRLADLLKNTFSIETLGNMEKSLDFSVHIIISEEEVEIKFYNEKIIHKDADGIEMTWRLKEERILSNQLNASAVQTAKIEPSKKGEETAGCLRLDQSQGFGLVADINGSKIAIDANDFAAAIKKAYQDLNHQEQERAQQMAALMEQIRVFHKE